MCDHLFLQAWGTLRDTDMHHSPPPMCVPKERLGSLRLTVPFPFTLGSCTIKLATFSSLLSRKCFSTNAQREREGEGALCTHACNWTWHPQMCYSLRGSSWVSVNVATASSRCQPQPTTGPMAPSSLASVSSARAEHNL